MNADRRDPSDSSGPVDADLPFEGDEPDGATSPSVPRDVPTTDEHGRPLENPSG